MELSTSGSDVFYVIDIVIDRSQGRATCGDEAINLTPTEFRLLAYLTQRSVPALSRGQILEVVWDVEAALMDERVVNVHIHWPREKVELDPSKSALLLTVPGIGYRLVG